MDQWSPVLQNSELMETKQAFPNSVYPKNKKEREREREREREGEEGQ